MCGPMCTYMIPYQVPPSRIRTPVAGPSSLDGKPKAPVVEEIKAVKKAAGPAWFLPAKKSLRNKLDKTLKSVVGKIETERK